MTMDAYSANMLVNTQSLISSSLLIGNRMICWKPSDSSLSDNDGRREGTLDSTGFCRNDVPRALKENCRFYMGHNPEELRTYLLHPGAFGMAERKILPHYQETGPDGGQQAHRPLGIVYISPLHRIDSSLRAGRKMANDAVVPPCAW